MIRHIIPRKPVEEWKAGDIVKYKESGNPADFTVQVKAVNGDRFDFKILSYVNYPDMLGRDYENQRTKFYRWVSSGLA